VKKINLFFILAFKEQTYTYEAKVKQITAQLHKGLKPIDTTLTWHYVMLSHYCNLYNFFEYEEKIAEFENAVIYHLPYGKDDRGDEVDQKLEQFKGRVPIVMRSYDAHSPRKTSVAYMDRYHDLVLTYLRARVTPPHRIFAQIAYDNFLVMQYDSLPTHRKFASMVLRREQREGYFETHDKFLEQGLDLQKTYHLREKFATYEVIDVYGSGWDKEMPNYKGSLSYKHKHQTLHRYKFHFVLENAIVDNYLSEKIFDAFVSLTVPVYLGSPVVEQYIPKACFIDIRDFESYDALMVYLASMSEEEYATYITHIRHYRAELFDAFSTKNSFVLPLYHWYKEQYRHDLDYSPKEFDAIEERIVQTTLQHENRVMAFLKKLKTYIQKKWF